MAVSLMTVTGKTYYRVYRRWGKTTVQRYYPVAPNPDKAYQEALADDESLAVRQRAYHHRRVATEEYLIKPDGRVRGIQKTRDYRYENVDVYRVQIRIPWQQPQRRGWFSVKLYGDYDAFRRAVYWLCEYIGISRNGELCMKLLKAYPHYEGKKPVKVALPEPSEQDDIEVWSKQLAHDIEKFKAKNRTVRRRR